MNIKFLLQRETDFGKVFLKNIEKPKSYPCIITIVDNSYIYVYPEDFWNVGETGDLIKEIEKLETLGEENPALKERLFNQACPFKSGDIIQGKRAEHCDRLFATGDFACLYSGNDYADKCVKCPEVVVTTETFLIVGLSYYDEPPYYKIVGRRLTLQNKIGKRTTKVHPSYYDLQPFKIIGYNENYMENISYRSEKELPEYIKKE